MTLTEKDALLDRLSALAEYYEKPKSPATLAIYVQELNDLPFPAIAAALKHHVNHGFPLFPKVSEIRLLVEGVQSAAATDAWRELYGEFRRVGSWGQPRLSSTTAATVLALCGDWERACVLIGQCDSGPELQGWQKRFQETFAVMAAREQQTRQLPAPPALTLVPSRVPAADGDT